MAVKDIKSNLLCTVAARAAVSANGDVTGAIIDTKDHELGLMFALDCTAYTDGTHTLQVLESDDSGMSGATAVTGDKLIGTNPVVSAAVAEGDDLGTLGVISNKRYVQVNINSTGVTTGATLEVLCIQKAELMPVE